MGVQLNIGRCFVSLRVVRDMTVWRPVTRRSGPTSVSRTLRRSLSKFDELVRELMAVRDVVAERDRAALLGQLEQARTARRNLPTTIPRPEGDQTGPGS